MSISVAEFWRLFKESRLLTDEQVQYMQQSASDMKGGDRLNAKTLAQWLISQNAVTDYQSQILLAGHSGPFYYGDYKVYDRIAEGRLAGMFRAIHAPTSHPALLQFLTGPALEDAELWSDAADRAVRQSELRHTNLITIYEPVDLTTFKFAAIEDAPGQTLEGHLARRPLPPAEACRVIRSLALGLSAMHAANLVHGDIRPANIWLEPTGNVRLIRDPFFVPQSLHASQQDAPDKLSQRADYMAPELGQPGKEPDTLTDIYALGCTLYQLLTGNVPFAGGDVMQKLNRHATEPIASLEQQGIPQPIAQLTAYLMAKNASIRYQQAEVVAEQLTPFVNPDYLNAQASPAPQTTPAYLEWIRTKSSALPAAKTPGPVIPAVTSQPSSPFLAETVDADVSSLADRAKGKKRSKPSPASGQPDDDVISQKTLIQIAVGIGVTALLIIGGLIAMNNLGGGDDPIDDDGIAQADGDGLPTVDGPADSSDDGDVPAIDENVRGVLPTKNGGNNGGSNSKQGDPVQVIADDGKSLWESPTAGGPWQLKYLPLGAQVYFMARPAAISASPEGEKVLRGMGEKFANSLSQFEKAAGVPFNQMESIVIGLHGNSGDMPVASFRITLAEPRTDLVAAWGNPTAATEGGDTYYTGGGWGYYAPEAEEGKVFLMTSPELAKEVAGSKSKMPLLRGQLEKLLADSDTSKHFTILFAPNFFFTDGEKLFSGELRKVHGPLQEFIGRDIKAGMISTHFGDLTYFEMRLFGDLGNRGYTLAEKMSKRVEAFPTEIENYIAFISASPYWRKVANRYPQMIRALSRNSRIGAVGEQAIMNAYLPASAGHNLVAGTELVIAANAGGFTPPETTTGVVAKPKNFAEAIEKKMSISFGQQSLEFAMRDIETEFNDTYKGLPFDFRIRILGNDLKLNGITRNQQIREFKKEDKSIADILTSMVMKANPVTTVKTPDEADQKLIWVIAKDPDDGKDSILITTRDAAATKKYELPTVFQPENP